MAARKKRLPPRWFIKAFWRAHRRVVRTSGGRKGLWAPRPGKWGALRITTTGRRSGEPRSVIAEPAWWLNLQAEPRATVDLVGGKRLEVLGRGAVGDERERLWQRWREIDDGLDDYAARRPRETAVVVLEPSEPVTTT